MKAMVLCAGYGTRLGERTRQTPKPMLPLCGHPILSYILAHLRSHNFDEIAVNLHFMPEMIQNYFGNGSKWNVHLNYSFEPELLGTAGGVKKMELFLRDGNPFLVQYGDVVTDQDFTAMLRFHQERKSLVTLLLHQRTKSNSIVSLAERGQIVGFQERPGESAFGKSTLHWVNSGICICAPEIFDHIPAARAADFPRDVFTKLVPTGRLYGFPLSGYRCAIDSPERLAEAEAALKEKRCRIDPPTPVV